MGYIVAIVVGLILVFVISGMVNIGNQSKETNKEKVRELYNKALVGLLTEKVSPQEARELFQNLRRHNSDYPIVARFVQLIHESSYHALNSKNRDVAESRMENVIENYKLFHEHKHIDVSEEVIQQVKEYVENTKNKFHTALYLNSAEKLFDKAKSLKTTKAKTKYLEQAIEILNEGRVDPDANRSQIQNLYNDVTQYKNSL